MSPLVQHCEGGLIVNCHLTGASLCSFKLLNDASLPEQLPAVGLGNDGIHLMFGTHAVIGYTYSILCTHTGNDDIHLIIPPFPPVPVYADCNWRVSQCYEEP